MGRSGDVRKWVVLILFCLFSSSNAIQWITFAPIATPARLFFNLSTDQLNYLSSIYMIVFALGVVFTCSTFERWGVRRGVLIGSGLNAIGSILKVAPGLFYPSFTTMIIAQTINAIAQLFVLSTPPLIAAHYFPPRQRALATAIASTSNSLGNAIALFVPPLIVKSPSRRSFMTLFSVELAYCCSVFVGVIFFLHPPRHPPRRWSTGDASLRTTTPTAEASLNTESFATRNSRNQRQIEPTGSQGNTYCTRNEHIRSIIHVFRAAFHLLKSRDFLFLFLAFSISMGSVWTFASVLTQMLEPFGVSQELAGFMGAGNILLGTATAYGVGAWVGQSRKYKLTLLICLLFSALCCSGLIITMTTAAPYSTLMDAMCSVVYILAGLGQNTAIPICFEFAMEITHPLPESVPGALLMAGANIASLILLSVSSALLGDGIATQRNALNVMIVVSVVSMVGGVFALVPVEKLRRYEAELNEQQQELQTREGSGGSAVAAGNCVGGVSPSLRCEDHTRGHSLREGGDAPNNSHTSLDCGVREANGVGCDGQQGQL